MSWRPPCSRSSRRFLEVGGADLRELSHRRIVDEPPDVGHVVHVAGVFTVLDHLRIARCHEAAGGLGGRLPAFRGGAEWLVAFDAGVLGPRGDGGADDDLLVYGDVEEGPLAKRGPPAT